jgi:hypothetical protein
VQGCVEQAHNAVYAYLHHLWIYHGENFNWAELLPSVAYMHNTAVQTHKSESPMFQHDSRDNRLVNANTLATDDIIPEDEYRRRFDPSFGVRQGQQLDDPEMHNGDMQQCTAFACWSYCNGAANNGDGGNTTNAYDSRQEHTAADNARAVKRNQNRMDNQTAADEVLFHEGDTVLIRVLQRCRTKLDPANIVGQIRNVQVTPIKRRYNNTRRCAQQGAKRR